MMANCKPDLEFPFLKDDTQFIQHENVLYKVKVKYDEESFKGKKVSFTSHELNYDLEEAFRAILYMVENSIQFNPIETDFVLIIPFVRHWSFPIKYPNYLFQRDGKNLEVSDILLELHVKHVDVLNGKHQPSPIPENSQTRKSQHSILDQQARERTSIDQRIDNELNTSRESRFKNQESRSDRAANSFQRSLYSHENNPSTYSGLRLTKYQADKYTKLPEADDGLQKECSNYTESKHMESKRVTGKRKLEKILDSNLHKSRREVSNRLHSDTVEDNLEKQPMVKGKANAKPNASMNSQQKTTTTVAKSPNTCIDCLEEHQLRRRSNRLKTKPDDGNSEQEDRDVMQDRNNSRVPCTEHSANSANDTVTTRSRSPSVIRYKNPTPGLHGSANLNEDSEAKQRKKDPSNPVLVYRDILQTRNKDRYVLEQLERNETTKLGGLYDTTAPRRSARQVGGLYDTAPPRRSARQATQTEGRLSGMWNRIWGTIFTPKK